MSCDSEDEEFYDASEVTPIKDYREPASAVLLETAESSLSSSFNKFCRPTEIPSSKNEHSQSTKCVMRSGSHCLLQPRITKENLMNKNVPSLISALPLGIKLTSSLPTLHLEESTSSLTQQPSFYSDGKSSLMPPPKTVLPKCEEISPQVTIEDGGSTCSESLLETLSCMSEIEVTGNLRRRGRRDRTGKNARLGQEDDEDCLSNTYTSNPGQNSASSLDAFTSVRNSAPFRVVEVDATSTYSTNFSLGRASAQGTKTTAKCVTEQNVDPNKETSSISPIHSEGSAVKSKEVEVEKETDHQSLISLTSEPDVVASTKSNSLSRSEAATPCNPTFVHNVPQITLSSSSTPSITVSVSSPSKTSESPPNLTPVPPPRRKKLRSKDDDSMSLCSVTSLPMPIIPLKLKDEDAVSRRMNLKEASKGNYIVKTQDTFQSKAPCSTDSTIKPPNIAKDRVSKNDSLTRQSSKKSNEASERNRAQVPRASFQANKSSSKAAGKHDSLKLSDEEILRQVSLLNLDTGESIPLSEADDSVLPALNPLSLHIMKLTNEMNKSKLDKEDDYESDEDEGSIVDVVARKLPEVDPVVLKKKTSQLKKFLGKRMESAVTKAKALAHKNKEEKDVFEDDAPAQNMMQYVKIKTSHSHKAPIEFDNLMYVQELQGDHVGPVWCMKFSPCGRLLATAGQDHVLRVWVLKQAFLYFLDIRTKWNADVKSSPTPSQESLVSQHSSHSNEDPLTLDLKDDGLAPFMPKPFCVYYGHTADVLDLSWSKSYFMLTSSMDKTVRLWHINRKECLCIFKHVDFVTAIAFHPKDDRYFISGSLDGKLRLWSIPDKQVVLWNEVENPPQLITAANFCQNGSYIVVGTYNGRCIFYKTDELKYFTVIHVKSSRGKHAQGRKITGIEPLPENDMLLITSNDSRIRLYDLTVLNVSCKYRGHSNFSSQIRAGFSHDGKFIVSGSENQCIYIWKTHHDYSKNSSARKDRNNYWEGVKAHSAVVTCAIFSPRPEHVFSFIDQQEEKAISGKNVGEDDNSKLKESNFRGENLKDSRPTATSSTSTFNQTSLNVNKGYVLVSADFNGCIKIFLKREKPKHSSLPASAMS